MGKNIQSTAYALALPVAEKLGFNIWDLEYKKEGADYFLRVYIDKEDGISIDDCEQFSRAYSAVLDRDDPIDTHYFLEISSAGLDRRLNKQEHFERYIGTEVDIKLFKPIKSRIEILEAKLLEYTPEYIKVQISNEEEIINFKDISQVKLSIKL
jgi:ribosome maturation factor RimP